MWRLGNIIVKSQFNGRLRQVTGQEQLNRWMLMLRLWQEISGDIEDWSGAEEVVGGV